MPLAIVCPSCGYNGTAPDTAFGRQVTCPQCRKPFKALPAGMRSSGTLPPPAPIMPAAASGQPSVEDFAGGRGNEPTLGFAGPNAYRRQDPSSAKMLLMVGGTVFAIAIIVGGLLIGGVFRSAPPARSGDERKVAAEPEQNKPSGKEAEDRELQALLKTAVPFQAPPLDKSKPSEINDFTEQMRRLAGEEEAFRAAKGKVYRATFDQSGFIEYPEPKTVLGRNVLVTSGTYSEDLKQARWAFYLWYHRAGQTTRGTRVIPEDTDACVLSGSIDQDETTYRQWKEAFDKQSLQLTIWFRLLTVQKHTWKPHPLLPKDGVQSHDIAFNIQILHMERGTSLPSRDPTEVNPPVVKIDKSARKKLLDALEDRGREELATVDAEAKRLDAEKQQIDREYELFRQSPRFGNLFDKEVLRETNDFQRRFAELARKWNKLQSTLDVLAYNHEQDRRRILLKYPEPGDPELIEYKGLVLTRAEVGAYKQFEQEHGSPKQAADVFVNSLLKSGTIKKASSAAVAADPTDAKTAAVVYLVNATLQGRAVYKYPYHVFVYRRDDGFWFVTAETKKEQGLVLGPPPKGFKPTEEAPATDVTIPFVALYLKSPEVAERVKAAEDLLKLDVDAKEVSLYLCEGLIDPTPAVHRAVGAALDKVNPALKKPVNSLLTNPSIQPRIDAANQIAKMGDAGTPALPVLIHVLRRDKAALVRAAAADALGELGADNDEATEVLTTAQKSDPSDNVKKAAAKGLEKLKDKRAAP